MTNPPEEKLEKLINYEIVDDSFEFRKWFLTQFDGDDENQISLEEFAVYFLNNLRRYTEVHIRNVSTETPARAPKSTNDTEDVSTPAKLEMNILPQENFASNNHLSTKNTQSTNNSTIDYESNPTLRLSKSAERLPTLSHNSTSTPIRRNVSKNAPKLSNIQSTPNKSCPSSLCLGDFLVLNMPTNNRSHKKKKNPTANKQSTSKSQPENPKRHLQPYSTTKKLEKSADKSSVFAVESKFSEDNILKRSNTELEDKAQCDELPADKSFNASEITKEIKNVSTPQMPAATDIVNASTPKKEMTTKDIPLDIKKLENKLWLKRLVDIYVLIIDLNLTTNILNELSFLLNMLNAPSTSSNVINEACIHVGQLDKDSKEKCLSLLEDAPNAIYFALLCLENVKLSLASLDAKSLGVVLISERFSYLRDDVKTYLLEMYQRKQNLATEKPLCDTSLCFDSKACNNVYFQHEHDSRENFCSHQEFTNFRAQRDLFYTCLKIWEANHLNPSWKFCIEIEPKIREIFNISEDCINMAHLAKLFVSQLLLSASNASSPAEIGLDVDLLKFSKLTQRLIAPGQFSVDYKFPRTEAFFRDFIVKARSLAFAEQLKIELFRQLTTQNESSLDHINISKDENNADEENISINEGSLNIIVKPDILNSMMILAKFLGFTTSFPYTISSCSAMPAKVEMNQIRLRSLMQPTFDVYILLEQAIEQSKLLVVVPWLVQYLGMLDNITLQLERYMKALKLLYAVYTYLGLENPNSFCHTSLFIIKLCLGWLFESKQFIAEQYYRYRAMLKRNNTQKTEIEFDFVKNKLGCNTLGCKDSENINLNAHLESLLPIACPFLAEFRVTINPAKYAQTKNASRTGRYRHITTRLSELPKTTAMKDESSPNSKQNYLIQAFLHSQSESTRQVIKFCTERCYKSTVKDGQVKILLPAKLDADNIVNQITSFEYQFVYDSIKTIYDDAYTKVNAEWRQFINRNLNKRINNALESLLPEETSADLKKSYYMIIEQEAAIKISNWFCANIISDNYFCPNLKEMADKICSANQNKVQLGTNQLTIINEIPRVSDLIQELQYWLHCTSVRVDRFKDSRPLIVLLKNFIKSFENELPSVLYHLLSASIVQLLQHIVAKHCAHLSDELIDAACQVWSHPNILKSLNNAICIYKPFVSKIFLESLGNRKECFNQLTHLITTMIKKQIITVNDFNELFVSSFKHEWEPGVLNKISDMLNTIAKETSGVQQKSPSNNNENGDDENEKSNLFMEMLADLSRDVDFY